MLRTSVPVSVWIQEGETVINTALRLLGDDAAADPTFGSRPADWGLGDE